MPGRRASRPGRWQSSRGVALLIALVMLVIIALTSAASLRSAISAERSVNHLREEALAQQYAEQALQYCEAEIAKDTGDRVPSLRLLPDAGAIETAGWTQVSTWTGGPANGLADVPLSLLGTAAGGTAAANAPTFVPSRPPQCYAERVTLQDGSLAHLVTARGYSPGYSSFSDGQLKTGSVVWLQSVIALQ